MSLAFGGLKSGVCHVSRWDWSGALCSNSRTYSFYIYLGHPEQGLVSGISLFLPYERNTEQVRMPAPVGSGGLG
jgi:hypothetical protein